MDKQVILESLERAAELYGDIAPRVYEDLFNRHPEARELFAVKGPAFVQSLQDKMVQDSLYAFLEYLETPDEVDIVFKYAIPQHQDLGIPIRYFNALLRSVADIVCGAVDIADLATARSNWAQLTAKLETLADHHAR